MKLQTRFVIHPRNKGMCERFALPDKTLLACHLPIARWGCRWPGSRYNVAPTARAPIVLMAEDGLLELNGARAYAASVV